LETLENRGTGIIACVGFSCPQTHTGKNACATMDYHEYLMDEKL
jgi:hypothetical protein